MTERSPAAKPSPTPSADTPAPAGSPLTPESTAGQSFGEWIRGLARRGDHVNDRESLAEMLGEEMQAADRLAPVERLMLLNILRLGDKRIGDVMVPRADILGVDASTSLANVIRVFRNGFHSRVPVFRATMDEIVGFIHIKDVLGFWNRRVKFSLRDVAREILFVPSSMRVVDLLLKMRLTRVHMGIVVDEYGGTDGLVTIEDLVEEIVGEIEDEHERATGPLITVHPDGTIAADGRAPIEELENRIGVDLVPDDREEDIDTIGGMLISLIGRVPLRGELIAHPTGLEFEVLEADPRRVKRVRIAGLAAVAKAADTPATSDASSDE